MERKAELEYLEPFQSDASNILKRDFPGVSQNQPNKTDPLWVAVGYGGRRMIWGNTPWEIAYQWPRAKHLGVGRRILERYDWHRLKPIQDWILVAEKESQ